MVLYSVSIDESGSVSLPLKLAASQAEQPRIDTHTITVRKGFDASQAASEHACPLGLHSTGPTNS